MNGPVRSSLVLLAFAVSASLACAPPEAAPRTVRRATSEAARAAVVVDYFDGSKATSACSGTLLSPRVVLTAASCVRQGTVGRVTSISQQHRSARVVRAVTYASHASDAPDTALLVLREPIALSRYPRILAKSCHGCQVVHVGRAGAKLAMSPPVALVASASQRHDKKLVMADGRDDARHDAGGALLSRDGHLVGLMVGRGTVSAQRYVIPLTDRASQEWIRTTIASTTTTQSSSSSASAKSLATQSLHPLDDEIVGSDGSEDVGEASGGSEADGASAESSESSTGLGDGDSNRAVDGYVDDSSNEGATQQASFERAASDPKGSESDVPPNSPDEVSDPVEERATDDDVRSTTGELGPTEGAPGDDIALGGTPDVDPTADPPSSTEDVSGADGDPGVSTNPRVTTYDDGTSLTENPDGSRIGRDGNGDAVNYYAPTVSADMTPENVKADSERWSQYRLDQGLNTVGPDGSEANRSWTWALHSTDLQNFGAKHDVQASEAQLQAMRTGRLADYAAANKSSATQGALYTARWGHDAGVARAKQIFAKYGFDVSPANEINVRPRGR